ncbi:unnamed protein product [Closterium sp. Yama58-4]|nr:unnamed protein product [Closterium sp. Yama58-4]
MSGGGLAGNGSLDDELARSHVVRLRGLPFSATESDIKAFFDGLDIAPDGIVLQLNYQGRATGQAFVRFADAENATKALERNRQHIGSRYIEVFKGHAADMEGALRMAGRGGAAGAGPGAGALGMGMGGMGGNMAAATSGLLAGAAAGAGVPGMAGNTDMRYSGVIRMRGMPYSATSADIAAFFKGMQIAHDGIFLCSHPDGRATGEAFVEFANEETAARALQLHREPMGHRYVELFRSTKGEMMAAVQQRMYSMFPPVPAFMGPVPGMMGFGMPSLGAANLAAMHMGAGGMGAGGMGGGGMGGPGGPGGGMGAAQAAAAASENVCIKMRGLPFSAGQEDILAFFEGYEVVGNGVHIMTGHNDRPTGEAFVEFASSEEAGRAMERHRQHMGNRYIELFRVSKSEALVAVQGGSLAGFNMAGALDPNMQLLLLQQQGGGGGGQGFDPSHQN